MGPWLIGFILAYVLFKVHNKNFKMNRVVKIVTGKEKKSIKFSFQVVDAVLWIVSLSVIFTILVGFLQLQQFENNHSAGWANALYISLHRNA